MKKEIILFLLLISGINTFAQGTWGAQAFGTLSWYDPNETENEKHLAIGYGGGISAVIPIKEKWSIRQQVNFQTRKYTLKEEETSQTPNSISYWSNKMDINENLLDLFSEFTWESTSGFGLSFGPRFGIGMSRKYHVDAYSSYSDLVNGTFNELSSTNTVNGYSDYREISFCLGASYRFHDNFRVEARYQQSLLVFDETNSSTEKWSLFQIGFSYVFSKKSEAE